MYTFTKIFLSVACTLYAGSSFAAHFSVSIRVGKLGKDHIATFVVDAPTDLRGDQGPYTDIIDLDVLRDTPRVVTHPIDTRIMRTQHPHFNIKLIYSCRFSLDSKNPKSYQMDYLGVSLYPQFGDQASYGSTSGLVKIPATLHGKGTVTCKLLSQQLVYAFFASSHH